VRRCGGRWHAACEKSSVGNGVDSGDAGGPTRTNPNGQAQFFKIDIMAMASL